MVPAAAGPTNQKPLDRHVRDMVSTITNRVSNIPSGGAHMAAAGDDDGEPQQQQGVRVVTLAGTNTGATMRGQLDDQERSHNARPRHQYYSSLNKGKNKSDETSNLNEVGEEEEEEEEGVGTYVNSNFQAVNNSIMLDSNYNTNDPGVHMDISDHRNLPLHRGDRLGIRKGKKNGDHQRFRSPLHHRQSDDDDDDDEFL